MANSFPILTFHDIQDSPSAISFPPDVFLKTMTMISERGYQTISLSRIIEYIDRDCPFPDRTLSITFDDGYESAYREAFPVLQKYGMTATVFLIMGGQVGEKNPASVSSLRGRRMLNLEQIHEMQRAGIEFGSHSLTHPNLTRLPAEQVEREVRESKIMLEHMLESEVCSFAYPYGYNTHAIREIVKKHYSLACSGRLGLVKRSSEPFALERVDMYYFRTTGLSRLFLSKFFPFYVHLRNIPRQFKMLRSGRLL